MPVVPDYIVIIIRELSATVVGFDVTSYLPFWAFTAAAICTRSFETQLPNRAHTMPCFGSDTEGVNAKRHCSDITHKFHLTSTALDTLVPGTFNMRHFHHRRQPKLTQCRP